jgi:hypothetical protein
MPERVVHASSPVAKVSISERIAKVFGFRNRMQVVVAEVCSNSKNYSLAADSS